LGELGDFEHTIGNQAKTKAYRKAVTALRMHPSEIKGGNEAMKIDGIGKKIAKKIDEILATGKLNKLEKFKNDEKLAAAHLISKITGIGPAAAKQLIDKGVRTLDDLRKRSNELTHHQQIGLKYFEELELRIPRDEMILLEEFIKNIVHKVDSEFVMITAGSYRRGAVTSGDIDILLTHPKFNSEQKKGKDYLALVVQPLKDCGFLTDDITNGRLKYMGICKYNTNDENTYLHRRIDFRIFNPHNFPCALLHNTGSDFFNNQMRLIANQKGFTLNEYEIRAIGETKEKGEPLEVMCEQDVFDILGLEYRAPEERSL